MAPSHEWIDQPQNFIPMAEETGLILPLDRYVLDKACRQVRSIQERLHVDLPISINLSPRQFQETGLWRRWQRPWTRPACPRSCLFSRSPRPWSWKTFPVPAGS